MTSGYWENPELNKVSFVEGALRTGDLGYKDSEGFLFITGRIKDVINVGGYKVFRAKWRRSLMNSRALPTRESQGPSRTASRAKSRGDCA